MKRLKALSRLGHGANDMYWFILPTVLPLILAQYGFSYTVAGAFITAFLCAVAVMSFLMGRLADRRSRAFLIAGGFFLASGSLAVAGLVSTFPLFMFFIIFTAVGASTYHPVIYSVIDETEQKRRGRMYAHFELYGALGVIILLLAYGLLVDSIGWKGVVLVACVPGFVMGGLYAANKRLLVRDKPLPDPSATVAQMNMARGPGAGVPPVLLLFFASTILRTLTSMSIMNFMPTYMAQGVGLDPTLSAYSTGLLFLGAVIASLFIGNLADRYGAIRLLFTASLSTGFFLIASTYLGGVWMLPLSLLVLGASISAATPAQNLVLSALVGAGRKGTAFGALMGIMTIANALGPVALGVVADKLGLPLTFRLASIPVFLSAILVMPLSRNSAVAILRVPLRARRDESRIDMNRSKLQSYAGKTNGHRIRLRHALLRHYMGPCSAICTREQGRFSWRKPDRQK